MPGFWRMIWPMRTARSFDDIFPNSCRTEIGLISPTRDVNDPSSFLFGTIDMIALPHEIGVLPDLKDSLINVTMILSNGDGAFSIQESSTRRRTRSQLTPSIPAALLVSHARMIFRTSSQFTGLIRSFQT